MVSRVAVCGNYFIELDKEIEEYKSAGRRSEPQEVIKKCASSNKARGEYPHDMWIYQLLVILNRKLISILLLKYSLDIEPEYEFESVHNYISDDNIISKGTISATCDERCTIPLKNVCWLSCTGKGNRDWKYSAPHGVGLVMSQSQVYERISMENFEASMKGIYSESVVEDTKGESSMIHKPVRK